MSILAVSLNNSPARCGRPPTPADAKLSLPGWRPGERDELAHVLGGNVARDDQHLRHRRHQRDRREILCDVVGHLFHRRVDDERTRADDADRVAVGCCLCDRVGAEHAALAAAIVDHDRLLDQFRHALADHARDDVVGPAGRERHDQLDRLVRENPAPRPVPATTAAPVPSSSRPRNLMNASPGPASMRDDLYGAILGDGLLDA